MRIVYFIAAVVLCLSACSGDFLMFRQNAQPLYAALDTNLAVLGISGYSKDSVAFEQLLRKSIAP